MLEDRRAVPSYYEKVNLDCLPVEEKDTPGLDYKTELYRLVYEWPASGFEDAAK